MPQDRLVDPAFFREAEEVVGDRHVVRDPEVVAAHTTDWTGRFRGSSPAVLRPGSDAEVEALVALCRRRGVPLVLYGGNTGLSGGTVPLRGEIVCSLVRLTTLEVDPVAGQATAGAGVTIGALQEAASAAGWAYGVDLASRASATVGGSVATNAGGVRMLRYGDTRAQLLGMSAVMGSGELVSHLTGLLKDNTGYHLPGLLCGSEGTLGVVTAARLRLVPRTTERVVALLGFADAARAVEAAATLRRGLASLSAVELFFAEGMALVLRSLETADPLGGPHAAYLLVEASADGDPSSELAAAVEGLAGVEGVAVASEPARMAELWRLREGHTEAINRHGTPHKLDISVPIGALADFVAAVPAAVASVAPGAEAFLFGHAADGNVHVNVTGVAVDDETVDDAVFRLAASFGGSVSAEHGIGTAKRRWLALSRSEAELSVFRRIKRSLDPDGILNPSVLLPD